MSSTHDIRKKTIMLIYSIEVGIVRFIRETQAASVRQLTDLMFGELMQTFGAISPTGEFSAFPRELKRLADELELSSIRNVCAHPVRDFDAHLWYRACAFVSDPRLQALGIQEPLEALASAEADRISTPPEEWLDKLSFNQLLNNLPFQESHDSTGLVGRDRELQRLKREILNGRSSTLALTGPGGVGKTSLAIELARNISLDVESKKRFNSIFFISFKQEFLTPQGVQTSSDEKISINRVETEFIAGLGEVYELENLTLQEMGQLLTDEKILVVMDNLEDLILSRSSDVDRFLSALPRDWFVLVTSRIPLDGAKNEPVPPLSEGAMETLGRRYYKKSVGQEIEHDLLKNLVAAADGIPLALKLMIDRIVLGNANDESIKDTIVDVLEFSFKSLLESLDEDQEKVLECVFVVGTANREEIIHLTRLSEEVLSEKISSLYRTSLLNRLSSDTGEHFQISSAIRPLMSRRPVDMSYRKQLNRDFQQAKIGRTQPHASPKLHRYSYSPNAPFELVQKAKSKDKSRDLMKIYQTLSKHESNLKDKDYETVSEIDARLESVHLTFSKYPEYSRLRAICKFISSDLISAQSFAEEAVNIDSKCLLFVSTLADILISNQNNVEAERVLRPAFEEILIDFESNKKIYDTTFLLSVLGAYFKVLIFEEQHTKVLELTDKWNLLPNELQSTFILSRCSALRRRHERSPRNDAGRLSNLQESLRLAKYALQELPNGSHPAFLKEVKKTVLEAVYRIEDLDESTRATLLSGTRQVASLIGMNIDEISPQPDGSGRSADIDFQIPDDALDLSISADKGTYAFLIDGNGETYFMPLTAVIPKRPVILKQGQLVKAWNIRPPNKIGAYPQVGSCVLQ